MSNKVPLPGSTVEVNIQNPWECKEKPLWIVAEVEELLSTQFTWRQGDKHGFCFYAHHNDTWRTPDA